MALLLRFAVHNNGDLLVSQSLRIDWSASDHPLSVRDIFILDDNWDRYQLRHRDTIREVEVIEVEKMLSCRQRGCFMWWCPNCGEHHLQRLGCNSRLCSRCGKRYADRWSAELAGKMFDVPHRHIVMTIASELCCLIRSDRSLMKVLMDSCIQALSDTFSYFLRRDVIAGAIVVLHPFGRDLGFRPHLHVLATEGGFDKRNGNQFVHKWFIPFGALRKTWQYQVLTRFKSALPKTPAYAALISRLFTEHREGFYVHAPKEGRIESKRKVARYVGRYVRHPAIANSRISGYEGGAVAFWFEDNEAVRHDRVMAADEFIAAVVQHVPERQFKMIRHYGAYNRRTKRQYGRAASEHGSIGQAVLADFVRRKWCFTCPRCGLPMELVMYYKQGPPEEPKFGSRITDWLCLA